MARSARKWTALGYAIVLAVLGGALWIFATNIFRAPTPADLAAKAVEPKPHRLDEPLRPKEVSLAPSGLAIPVDGVRPDQLIDTFTQARAGGAGHEIVEPGPEHAGHERGQDGRPDDLQHALPFLKSLSLEDRS